MIETLNYEEVPARFAHCLEKDCPLAGSCLHYQVSRFITPKRASIPLLNPMRPRPEGKCMEYRSDVPLKYAYGWNRMFDKLPYEKAIAIKQALLIAYGKNDFYRLKRKEKRFTPRDMEYVKSVFLRHGVMDEPVYEEYRYEYVWW